MLPDPPSRVSRFFVVAIFFNRFKTQITQIFLISLVSRGFHELSRFRALLPVLHLFFDYIITLEKLVWDDSSVVEKRGSVPFSWDGMILRRKNNQDGNLRADIDEAYEEEDDREDFSGLQTKGTNLDDDNDMMDDDDDDDHDDDGDESEKC
ncbi:hypothetical protein L1987_41860 [Smallanthus sonchifolius]|uniref:Uncharacterized protein n=1 Tax=Smallanthus sonchifolius TaxID=185202 RepID=A0ACB9GW48_9ASTR|nr:hypothetical protein L1987_41860 [Smallanthus sonchifolius]